MASMNTLVFPHVLTPNLTQHSDELMQSTQKDPPPSACGATLRESLSAGMGIPAFLYGSSQYFEPAYLRFFQTIDLLRVYPPFPDLKTPQCLQNLSFPRSPPFVARSPDATRATLARPPSSVQRLAFSPSSNRKQLRQKRERSRRQLPISCAARAAAACPVPRAPTNKQQTTVLCTMI